APPQDAGRRRALPVLALRRNERQFRQLLDRGEEVPVDRVLVLPDDDQFAVRRRLSDRREEPQDARERLTGPDGAVPQVHAPRRRANRVNLLATERHRGSGTASTGRSGPAGAAPTAAVAAPHGAATASRA